MFHHNLVVMIGSQTDKDTSSLESTEEQLKFATEIKGRLTPPKRDRFVVQFAGGF